MSVGVGQKVTCQVVRLTSVHDELLALDGDVVNPREGAQTLGQYGGISESRSDSGSGHRGANLIDGTVRDELSTTDEDDATGEGIGLLDVVGGENDRTSGVGLLTHDLPEAATSFNVQTGCRLVENKHIGVRQHREGETKSLPLTPPRAFADLGSGEWGQLPPLGEGLDPRALPVCGSDGLHGLCDGEVG